MDVLGGFALLGGLLMLYFTPSVVAFQRQLSNRWSVFVLNLLLGWTLIGWAIALAMAVSGAATTPVPAEAPRRAVTPPRPMPGKWGDEAAPTPVAPAPEVTKACPDCGETVLATARICRFCRHEFATV